MSQDGAATHDDAQPDRKRQIAHAFMEHHDELSRTVKALIWRAGLADNARAVSSLAEEVLQEAVTRAIRRAEAFDPNRPAHAWLYGFAVNVFSEYARRIKRDRSYVVDLHQAPEETEDDDVFERLADPNAADDLALGELLDLVTPAEADLLLVHYVERRPAAETAARLGITEGAVRVRACRAASKVRNAYLAAMTGKERG